MATEAHSRTGFFLSFDGVDGAGKSTQIQLVTQWLREQNRQVTNCRDPGGTPGGDRIRHLLLDRSTGHLSALTETFLYMASRCQLVSEVIRPALERGDIVLCDRFVLSTVVYQGYAGELDPGLCWELGRTATSNTLPDLTLIFDMSVDAALARKSGPDDRMEDKGRAYLEKVRAGFLEEARRDPEHHRIIQADASVEAVQQQIRKEISHALGRHLRT